jgi:hypothetical protein
MMSIEDNTDYVPNGLRRSLRKKYAVKSTRVQPLFNGMTHRPAVVKEGYLQKPAFFRFGGKKRRWCVLRTYSAIEASLDIFVDDTKTRYKGSICLDKEVQPTIAVKSADDGKHTGSLQNYYIAIKVGKNSYNFTTDTYKELKEWCALLRQIVHNIDGAFFSASIVEPHSLDDGLINVQFTSNYIALLCPVKEISIKRWRLEHITSFGQCGGILTFECCTRCTDPNFNRCSLNIKQEKPATILSLMEKTIRENPSTNEIHYERSILGDIYHCSHLCTSSPRIMPAFSDPNLTLITSGSANNSPYTSRRKPQELHVLVPSPELHRHDDAEEANSNTLESNDSGLPGTPQMDEESLYDINSPQYFGKPTTPVKKSAISSPHRSRSNSDRYTSIPTRDSVTPGRDTDESSSESDYLSNPLMHHTSGNKNGSLPMNTKQRNPASQTRSMTPLSLQYNKLESVPEPPQPPERRESKFRPSSNSPPNTLNKTIPTHSIGSPKKYHIPVGVPPPPPKLVSKSKSEPKGSKIEFLNFTDDDNFSYPEVPSRQRRGTEHIPRELPSQSYRERAQSHSDWIDSRPTRFRGFSKSTSDDLDKDDPLSDHPMDEINTINPFFRLDDLEYDDNEGENANEVMSNLADYQRHKNGYCEPGVIDKVLSKVACDNVRGYAYKISIPVAGNVVYDVPRRAAPLADPKHINPNAPKKPLRKPHNQQILAHNGTVITKES